MKIYAISDLHLSINTNKPMNVFGPVWDNHFEKITSDWNKKIKDKDIVLIPGDISWAMKLEEAQADIELISKLKGTKIIIKGNHDYWWDSISKLRNILPPNFYALQNDCIKIGKYIFCGSRGWNIPEGKFNNENNIKIFNRELVRMELSLKEMEKIREKKDKVIMLTHYPPFNFREQNKDVTNLFIKYKVDFVVYGHLHAYDKKQPLIYEKDKIKYFLTSCDLVDNKLIKIC